MNDEGTTGDEKQMGEAPPMQAPEPPAPEPGMIPAEAAMGEAFRQLGEANVRIAFYEATIRGKDAMIEALQAQAQAQVPPNRAARRKR